MGIYVTAVVQQEEKLDVEWRLYKQASLAPNTRSVYLVHIRNFLGFCHYFGYTAALASPITQCRYAAYLARTHSPPSIRCYMSGVRHLHLEFDHTPQTSDYHLTSVLKGIAVTKGTVPKQKLPITTDILLTLYKHLDLTDSFNLCFWSACLVGFFTFARKATLLTKTQTSHCCRRDMCRRDFTFDGKTAMLRIKHTKTIQTFSRELIIPLPVIEGSILCPVTTLLRSLLLSKQPPAAALFSYKSGEATLPLTHSAFTNTLACILQQAGYDCKDYSGHSLRRGGATFALACGLPTEVIKAQGDWASNAYERYTNTSLELRVKCAKVLGQHIESIHKTTK